MFRDLLLMFAAPAALAQATGSVALFTATGSTGQDLRAADGGTAANGLGASAPVNILASTRGTKATGSTSDYAADCALKVRDRYVVLNASPDGSTGKSWHIITTLDSYDGDDFGSIPIDAGFVDQTPAALGGDLVNAKCGTADGRDRRPLMYDGKVFMAGGDDTAADLDIHYFTPPTQAELDAELSDPHNMDDADVAAQTTSIALPVITEVDIGQAGNDITFLTGVGGYVVFAHDSDGAGNLQLGSIRLSDDPPTFLATLGSASDFTPTTDLLNDGASANPMWLTPIGNDLVVFACDHNDGGAADKGVELCSTDGVTANLVTDIDAAATDGVDVATKFYNWDGPGGEKVYFSGGDTGAGNGYELWATTGTAAGTMEVCDINTGAASSSPSDFISCGGNLFFAATDSSSSDCVGSTPCGRELWMYDGTSCSLVLDLDPAADNGMPDAAGANKLMCYQGYIVWAGTDDGTNYDLFAAVASNPAAGSGPVRLDSNAVTPAYDETSLPLLMAEAPWLGNVMVEPGPIATPRSLPEFVVYDGTNIVRHETLQPVAPEIVANARTTPSIGRTPLGSFNANLEAATATSGIWIEIDVKDTDGDGIPDGRDNCPSISNADQADSDTDFNGDACDACPGYDDLLDNDNDGTANSCDVFPCAVGATAIHTLDSTDYGHGQGANVPCDNTGSAGCGAGGIDIGEQCEDGGTTADDGCSATCQLETCGDFRVVYHCAALLGAGECGTFTAAPGDTGCPSFGRCEDLSREEMLNGQLGTLALLGADAFDPANSANTCEIARLPYDQWVPKSDGFSGFVGIASKGPALMSKTRTQAHGTTGFFTAGGANAIHANQGAMKGDPHFTSFSGGKYEVRGTPDHLYNIISDSHMQYNARFIGGAHGTTWIDQVGFMYNGHRFQWDASSNEFSYDGQDIAMQPNFFVKKQLDSTGKHYVSMSQGRHPAPPRLYINLPGFTITITRKQVPKIRFTMASHRDGKMAGEDGKWHFGARPFYFDHSAVQTHEANATHFVHGLLGQTARLTAPVKEYRHYQRHLHKNGEGVIEGKVEDYEVTSLFGSDFKFNQFKN